MSVVGDTFFLHRLKSLGLFFVSGQTFCCIITMCPRTPEFDIYTPQTAYQNSAQTSVNQAVTYSALAVPFSGDLCSADQVIDGSKIKQIKTKFTTQNDGSKITFEMRTENSHYTNKNF